jgi:exonuclease VII small subunit
MTQEQKQIEASLERFIERLESLNRMFEYGIDLRLTTTELRTIESVEKAIERLSRAFERAASRL